MKLEGVKVLDLSLFLPGPMLTLAMADHGANVIKIEPAGEGEPARHLGYFKNGESIWFRNTHRGKRSLQLDLKADSDRALFFRLAKEADVIVEAFRPGVVQRLGVDYEAVRAINPGIVYASLSAFGQSGPYRDRPAHDVAVEALAGLVALNEGQDLKPAMPHVPVADALVSLNALSGVLMALYRRAQTGEGDYLDVSMFESALQWTANVSPRIFSGAGPHMPKQERSWGGNAMYNLYETADAQWVVLGASELKFARNLLEAWGRLDLLDYAKLPPGAGQEPLRAFFRDQFKTKTRAEWEAWFEGRDIAFAPVRNLAEAFADPALRERGLLGFDDQGNEIVGAAIMFANEPARIDARIPGLNEHRAEIEANGWG